MNRLITCVKSTIRKGIWFPLSVFVLHELLAHIGGNLYDLWPPLDIPMHYLGGIAIAYFASVLLLEFNHNDLITIRSDIAFALLIIIMTTAAATFWEYAEWISDHTIGTQAQKGLDDTMFDTVVGLLGGISVVIVMNGKRILKEFSQH